MAERPVTYHFGRLNLIPIFNSYSEKIKYVGGTLRRNRTIQKRNHTWRFSQIGEFYDGPESTENLYYFGFLVKYKGDTAEVVIPETGEITDEAIENAVAAKSRFILHVISGLVAYRPVANLISEAQFRANFEELFEESNDRFFIDAEIQVVEDRFQVQEILKGITRVSKIQFYLHPSNPNMDDIWKDVRQDLVETHTKTYIETRETDPERTSGETILSNNQLLAKLLMSVDGYGETKVTGTYDGKTRQISTKNNPVTAQAPNDKSDVHEVFNAIRGVVSDIFARFNR